MVNVFQLPGIGKSAAVRGTLFQRILRRLRGVKTSNIKLAEYDSTDLRGLPVERGADERTAS